MSAALQRLRELTAPGHILSIFESAELEDLETQYGQQHLSLMPTPAKPAPIKSADGATLKSAPLEIPDKIERIMASMIRRSPFNRETFTKEGDSELLASVREHGIIQPILVRTLPAVPGVREIIFGERRWRAAKAIDADYLVPCRVVDATDRQVLELQKIENLQREDLDPIEEAQGLKQMMTEFGYSLDDLIQKLGKQKSTIYASLKLASLCPEGVKLFRAGELSVSAATRFARIPGVQLQAKAIKEAQEDWHVREAEFSDRSVAKFIAENFMKELKGAPFKLDDGSLVPEKHVLEGKQTTRTFGGRCTDCPMRSGNQPDFQPAQGRADVCLLPACHRAKLDALFKRESAAGSNVADPKKVFTSYGSLNERSGFVSVENRCYAVAPLKKGKDQHSPSYGELAAHLKFAGTLVQRPGTGEILTIIDRDAILAAAKKANLKMESMGDNSKDAQKWRAEQKAAMAKARKAAELRRAQLAAVVAAAETDNVRFLPLVVAILAESAGDNICRLIASRRKLDLSKHKSQHHNAGGHRAAVAALGREDLGIGGSRALIVELLASEHYEYSGHPDPLKRFADLFKVNLAKVATAQSSAEKAKAKPAKKPAAPAKPAAKLPKSIFDQAMKYVRKAKAAAKVAKPKAGKGSLTAEARAKIVATQKARWAKIRAAAAKKGAAK